MKKMICILLALCLMLGVCAIASAEEKGYKFGLMLYAEVDEATISIRSGFEKACAEYGVELEIRWTASGCMRTRSKCCAGWA